MEVASQPDLQSDPLERRFGHYRQISGGRCLVDLKDINYFETIAALRSILKEDVNLRSQSNVLKTSEIDEEEAEKCPVHNF